MSINKNIPAFFTTLFLLLFAFCPALRAAGPQENQTIRILYIGNSLTYVNDLPGMIKILAESRGHNIVYDVYARGGRKLVQHASDPGVLKKIREQPWDFVVLQEQSQTPAFSQRQVEKEVFPYAKKLTELSKQAHPKTRIVFYMTMARKNGDPGNAHVSPELGSYKGMQQRINRSYLKMARDNQALVAPVGMAWEDVRTQRPDINLYADDVHPNMTGTYLAACVFYATFFQASPMGLPSPKNVPPGTAAFLQKMAHQRCQISSY